MFVSFIKCSSPKKSVLYSQFSIMKKSAEILDMCTNSLNLLKDFLYYYSNYNLHEITNNYENINSNIQYSTKKFSNILSKIDIIGQIDIKMTGTIIIEALQRLRDSIYNFRALTNTIENTFYSEDIFLTFNDFISKLVNLLITLDTIRTIRDTTIDDVQCENIRIINQKSEELFESVARLNMEVKKEIIKVENLTKISEHKSDIVPTVVKNKRGKINEILADSQRVENNSITKEKRDEIVSDLQTKGIQQKNIIRKSDNDILSTKKRKRIITDIKNKKINDKKMTELTKQKEKTNKILILGKDIICKKKEKGIMKGILPSENHLIQELRNIDEQIHKLEDEEKLVLRMKKCLALQEKRKAHFNQEKEKKITELKKLEVKISQIEKYQQVENERIKNLFSSMKRNRKILMKRKKNLEILLKKFPI